MKTLFSRRGLTLVEVAILIVICCLLAAIIFPSFSKAKKAAEYKESALRKELGEQAKLMLVAIGKNGSETFYYLIPDEKAIQPLNRPEALVSIVAPAGHRIAKVQANAVVENGKVIQLGER